MSLPKRDGVHGRYYLIHKPDTDPEVLEHADQCIQDVLDGTAKKNHSGYPVVVRNQSGTPFLPSQLLERYLSKLPLKGFPYVDAVAFCDALRRLAGWKEIDHTLGQYIEHQVQERYFKVGEKEDYFFSLPALHRVARAAAGGCGRGPAAFCLLCGDLLYSVWSQLRLLSPPSTFSAWFPSFARIW